MQVDQIKSISLKFILGFPGLFDRSSGRPGCLTVVIFYLALALNSSALVWAILKYHALMLLVNSGSFVLNKKA